MKSKLKHISKILAIIAVTLICASCEKDGDKIFLYGHEDSEFTVTESDVVLTQERANEIVLSTVWTKSTLSVSNPNMHAPEAESVYIQISTDKDFASHTTENKETTLSKAYTGAELNTIAKNLGAQPDISTPLYFRLRSSVGTNTESKYSNVETVNVTPYEINMKIGYILDNKQEETTWTLYSPQADGIYKGFVGAPSWYNFYLREGDGTVWGNLGVDGSAFHLSADDSKYNCWFPSPGGCYFVEFNTVDEAWSALYIPSLTVSGDIQGEMTYDRPNNKWIYVFNAASAGNSTIRLSATGKQYNISTSDKDENAIDTPVGFGGSANALTFGNTAIDITVNVPGTGEYTLTVDLSNQQNWIVEVSSGSEQPDPVYTELYLLGIDDAITGTDWTFDTPIALYDEENKKYAGVVNINSKWGYQLAIEKDNWGDYYGLGEGDVSGGTLVFQATDNLPTPPAGLYVVEASLSELTYQHTPVGNQIWVMGMDDKYEFNTPLSATGTPGVYSGQITIVSDSPWGIEIQLNDSWAYKFGGTDGILYFNGKNIEDDKVHTPGTYTMTVDLINKTYTIV